MKTIASLPVGQANEIVERLNEMAIPHVTLVILYPSGADLTEIMVEESYFDRGSEIVLAWNAEQLSKLAAFEKPSSTPAATAKSKWSLFLAFCSGLFFVMALDALHDNNTSGAVIRFILSAFCILKAVHEQYGFRFALHWPDHEPETRSGKIVIGILQILQGATIVAYGLLMWRKVGGSVIWLLIAGFGALQIIGTIKSFYKSRHAA